MDIEFHYYMTYLIAAKAGLPPADARVLAYASQYVDDNDIVYEVDRGQATAYRNYISQTMNILKPTASLLRIYPIFHFIPGNPIAPVAFRKDGRMHWLNTTPGSDNALRIIDDAIATRDLYRIGIACHGFVDTWAHENFVGYRDPFNAMEGPLGKCVPAIGHAEAGHKPDWPALIWTDARLLADRIDNKARFLTAAENLFEKLAGFVDPNMSSVERSRRQQTLRDALDQAIGDTDPENHFREERIARYRALAETGAFGGEALPTYDVDAWFHDAVNEHVLGLHDHAIKALALVGELLSHLDPWRDTYTWKPGYRTRHWYRFQEAVKQHQNAVWDWLAGTNLKGMELPQL